MANFQLAAATATGPEPYQYQLREKAENSNGEDGGKDLCYADAKVQYS
ncbi:hypothetical protein Corgl_1179 [Coriobacterium glomerans PW2]|uniref:Uncharacterized protein n=1 Tax=Coriobacterium glomerans (strain ATCC 49209 / DSM 20642 / JCM 10262 / PW2) TaxID=700015 RepID=F2N8A2_CORGP|nr:hypothetical protein Corgl_1179 [Coriobacterium glomerans PW2]